VPDRRPRIKPVTALIADDVRREASGKDILIGVYTSQIAVGRVGPDVGIVVAVSMIFESPETGEIPVGLRIVGPDGELRFAITAGVNITAATVPNQTNALSIAGIAILLATTGNIEVKVRQYEDGEWETIRVLPVLVNPDDPGLKATLNAASIVSERPSEQSAPASS
jgi:hypothetical protein